MNQKISEHGPELSRIILGGWRWNDRAFPLLEQQKLVDKALELGITTFDHADIYGNYNCQFKFGELLKVNSSLRDKIQIVTKCGIKPRSGKFPDRKIQFYDTSSAHIISSTEDSLKALQTDYIDLLLIHRPDPLLDPDEVAEAFVKLKDQGKVRYFGVSNFSNGQFRMLQSRLGLPLVTNQIELSLTHTEPIFDDTLDFLLENKVCPMIWSPFGGGRVFGNKKLLSALEEIREKYDVAMSSLLIAWLLYLPSKGLPVVGTMNADRLVDVVEGTKILLERQDWYKMLKVARGFDVP